MRTFVIIYILAVMMLDPKVTGSVEATSPSGQGNNVKPSPASSTISSPTTLPVNTSTPSTSTVPPGSRSSQPTLSPGNSPTGPTGNSLKNTTPRKPTTTHNAAPLPRAVAMVSVSLAMMTYII
ncbi:hypothetical protein SNE40_008705 [Patella caerulea]|uniref:Uncharacterized protein n=1 Tax=Patella caerulea TaxID=87958 RepID=A0AAN8PNY6_PATCE